MPAAVRSDEKTWPPVWRVEARERRRGLVVAERDRVDRDAGGLGRLDRRGERRLRRCCRRRSGRRAPSSAWVRRRARGWPGSRSRRAPCPRSVSRSSCFIARRERVDVAVERVHGIGRVPEGVERHRVALALGLHEGRGGLASRRRAGAPSIERLTSSATPIAAGEPPPDWVVVTGSPFSLGAQRHAAAACRCPVRSRSP